MKKTLFLIAAVLLSANASAQVDFNPKRHVKVTLERGGPGFIYATIALDTAYIPLEMISLAGLNAGIPEKGEKLNDSRVDTLNYHLTEFGQRDSSFAEQWMTKSAPVKTTEKNGLLNLTYKCKQPFGKNKTSKAVIMVSFNGYDYTNVNHEIPLSDILKKPVAYVIDLGSLAKPDGYLVSENQP